jgi:hypothetical protein
MQYGGNAIYGGLEEKANYHKPWASMPFQPEHPNYSPEVKPAYPGEETFGPRYRNRFVMSEFYLGSYSGL